MLSALVVMLVAGTVLAQPDPAEPVPADDQAQAESEAEAEAEVEANPQTPDKAQPTPAEELAQQQQKIHEKYQHLERVLLRMAELSEATDPRRAALLKRAVRESGDRLINVQFEQLAEALHKDQLSRALDNQKDLEGDLRALLDLLMSENRSKRIEAEKARIREYLKRLNQLIKQQKDLQGRTQQNPNPEGLSGEQGRMAEKTGDLAKEIKRNEEGSADGQAKKGQRKDKGEEKGKEGGEEGEAKGEPEKPAEEKGGSQGQGQSSPQDQEAAPARQRLEAAQQRMKEAQEKLDQAQREGAVEKQEEAIRELEQAKADLEETLRQLREEEILRMLAMLEARFRKMLVLQREVYEGTVQLDAVPAAERSGSHEIEARRLGNKQQTIVVQCDNALLLLQEDGTAVAFPEAVGQVREDMDQVRLRLLQSKVDKNTQLIEEDIIAALEEMIDALKKAQKDFQQQSRPNPSPGEPQDPPLVDTLAELKMIRALQMRVNRRTERYSKLIEGEQAEKAELIEALQRLAEREQEIYRVTRDLEMGRNQ